VKFLRLTLVLTFVLGLCLPVRADEASIEAVQSAIRSNRKALIAVNLGLTDDESAKFWPVYDRYQKEMNAVGDRQSAVIQDYISTFKDVSNEKALQLMESYLTTDADRLAIRRAYVDDFAGCMPGRKVARFYQLENKIDAVIRYELAAQIPIVDEPAAPAP
jgi:regulator of sigma D